MKAYHLSFLTVFGILIEPMSSMLVGGWKEQDPNSPDVKKLALLVMSKVNEQENDMYHHVPVKVLSARSQVVSGINWDLEILAAQTGCRKSGDHIDLATCEAPANAPQKVYVVNAWQQPNKHEPVVTIKEAKAYRE